MEQAGETRPADRRRRRTVLPRARRRLGAHRPRGATRGTRATDAGSSDDGVRPPKSQDVKLFPSHWPAAVAPRANVRRPRCNLIPSDSDSSDSGTGTPWGAATDCGAGDHAGGPCGPVAASVVDGAGTQARALAGEGGASRATNVGMHDPAQPPGKRPRVCDRQPAVTARPTADMEAPTLAAGGLPAAAPATPQEATGGAAPLATSDGRKRHGYYKRHLISRWPSPRLRPTLPRPDGPRQLGLARAQNAQSWS
jgi:hypothetical protein